MPSTTDFTDRELHIMTQAWMCFDNTPKVDYDKLAARLGLAPRSVSNAFVEIKKKMAAQQAAYDDTPAPKTPKIKRKKADAELEEESSSAKKPKVAATDTKRASKSAAMDDEN